MRTTPELGCEAAENAPKITPEKDHLRDSRPENDAKSGRIVESSFDNANPRFRESLSQPPRKLRNAERRTREYLTPAEVEKLIKAAESLGRHGSRDGTLILVAYRHALRVSELVSLRWDQLDLAQGLLHVNRLKNGTPSTHPVRGPELRALRRLDHLQSHLPFPIGSHGGPPFHVLLGHSALVPGRLIVQSKAFNEVSILGFQNLSDDAQGELILALRHGEGHNIIDFVFHSSNTANKIPF